MARRIMTKQYRRSLTLTGGILFIVSTLMSGVPMFLASSRDTFIEISVCTFRYADQFERVENCLVNLETIDLFFGGLAFAVLAFVFLTRAGQFSMSRPQEFTDAEGRQMVSWD